MIQGTSSHAGKSLLTAALCRILAKRGLRVAPFKAQNMALNSFVAAEGGEIGMAQALQARAAGIEPSVDMNPVLLKPSADSVSQVIIHGRVYEAMTAREYHGFKGQAKRFVRESFERLSKRYDVIVIEGAGSPAEVNLRKNDIANMGMAAIAKSPVVIVGDIDRGGVFASFVGTVELLTKTERARVAGFIVNKFRGDAGLLKPGLSFLKRRTGVPTLGVIPYMKDILLPDEDSVSLERGKKYGASKNQRTIRLRIIKLPRISNFTDFDPFRYDPGVEMEFIEKSDGVKDADMVIIPGSKNTLEDLAWLKKRGFQEELERFVEQGGMLAGICAGFQMLGRTVADPHGVESGSLKESGRKRPWKTDGLCLIDAHTVLKKEKKTFRVKADVVANGFANGLVEGYEIHMGETSSAEPPLARITARNGRTAKRSDGAVLNGGLLWGTYIHGIFDNALFRAALLNRLRLKKGIAAAGSGSSHFEATEAALDRLARVVEDNLDMKKIVRIIGLPARPPGSVKQ
ncbi:MAG: cobyric acid synthase [Deltaproteobacteria bacterium]|nr:cobyric acid synthase [Deltaproteobacteria bacterium]